MAAPTIFATCCYHCPSWNGDATNLANYGWCSHHKDYTEKTDVCQDRLS